MLYRNSVKTCLLTFLICSCAEIPQITHFSVTPKIMKGQQAQVEWKVNATKNLKGIGIEGTLSDLESEGTKIIHPESSRNYTLMISYRKGKKILQESKSASITVENPEFSGTKAIIAGDLAELKWRVNPEAENVQIQEIVDDQLVKTWNKLPTEIVYQVKPLQTTTYVLNVFEEGELKTTLYHTIEVKSGFFTGTDKILFGEKATLIWKVNPGVKNLTLEERENSYTKTILDDELPLKGSKEVEPQQSSIYLLIQLTDKTTTQFSHIVEVVDGIFTGSKLVPQGETAVLTWKASKRAKKVWIEKLNNNKAEIFEDNLPKEGRIEFIPAATTTYILVVQNEDEDHIGRYPHTVKVQAPPRPFVNNVITFNQLSHNKALNFEIFSFDKDKYPQEIKMMVLATDNEGNYISGLAETTAMAHQYFRKIIEQTDGRELKLEDFKVKEVTEKKNNPYSLSLAIDYGGSTKYHLAELEKAITTFIKLKHPEDEVTVVKFDDKLAKKVSSSKSMDEIL